MADTITVELQTAIREAIENNAQWNYVRPRPTRITWLTTSELVTANQCPAIVILYRDSPTTVETIRGRDSDGNVLPGFALLNYLFDIHLWDKAERVDVLSHRLEAWGDVVRAALQDSFDLEGRTVVSRVDRGSQTETLDIGGAQMAALPLQVTVQAYTVQGDPALLST